MSLDKSSLHQQFLEARKYNDRAIKKEKAIITLIIPPTESRKIYEAKDYFVIKWKGRYEIHYNTSVYRTFDSMASVYCLCQRKDNPTTYEDKLKWYSKNKGELAVGIAIYSTGVGRHTLFFAKERMIEKKCTIL